MVETYVNNVRGRCEEMVKEAQLDAQQSDIALYTDNIAETKKETDEQWEIVHHDYESERALVAHERIESGNEYDAMALQANNRIDEMTELREEEVARIHEEYKTKMKFSQSSQLIMNGLRLIDFQISSYNRRKKES